ncbi:MAG: LptE family protein [Candidatus Omnitrophota bacterium]
MKINKLSYILYIVFIFIQGCGYTTKANFLPTHIKSVYIETFKNNTDQPNLENEFRTKMIATVQDDGNLIIVSADEADTVLKGQIINYYRQGLRYSNDDAIREYRLGIVTSFEFIDNSTDKAIVKDPSFAGDTTFYVTGTLLTSEDNARKDALNDLATRMLNKILTLW